MRLQSLSLIYSFLKKIMIYFKSKYCQGRLNSLSSIPKEQYKSAKLYALPGQVSCVSRALCAPVLRVPHSLSASLHRVLPALVSHVHHMSRL